MTQTPPSGQGAPVRTEFGSVTAGQPAGSSAGPGGRDARAHEWGSTSTTQAGPGAARGTNYNGVAGVASAPPAAPYDTRTTTNVPAYQPPPAAGGPHQPPAPVVAARGTPPPAPGAPQGLPPSGRSARNLRSRGPRRARLQLRHINPWTVLKFSCVLSIALFFVWLIVVGILFGVLDAAGVIKKLNDAYIQVNPGSQPPIRAGIVFGGAAIIGAVNIVLFIALSTVGAVVYNLCADLVGGIEITLSER